MHACPNLAHENCADEVKNFKQGSVSLERIQWLDCMCATCVDNTQHMQTSLYTCMSASHIAEVHYAFSIYSISIDLFTCIYCLQLACIRPSVCLSICLPVCLSVGQSVGHSIRVMHKQGQFQDLRSQVDLSGLSVPPFPSVSAKFKNQPGKQSRLQQEAKTNTECKRQHPIRRSTNQQGAN